MSVQSPWIIPFRSFWDSFKGNWKKNDYFKSQYHNRIHTILGSVSGSTLIHYPLDYAHGHQLLYEQDMYLSYLMKGAFNFLHIFFAFKYIIFHKVEISTYLEQNYKREL